ncbi:hypothetical protein D3C81_1492280 [compost metagenome]
MHRLAQVVAGGGQEARLGHVGSGRPVALMLELADQGEVLEAQLHAGQQGVIGDAAEIAVHHDHGNAERRVDVVDGLRLHRVVDDERAAHQQDHADVDARLGRQRRHGTARHAGQHDAGEGRPLRPGREQCSRADPSPQGGRYP